MAIHHVKGRAYYYRKRRVGGRVVGEYVGPVADLDAPGLVARARRDGLDWCGPADAMRFLDILDRAEREEARAEQLARERAERDALEEAERRTQGYQREIQGAVAAILAAAGYHKPQRRRWRKRRRRGEQQRRS